jgi:hypothetical protein
MAMTTTQQHSSNAAQQHSSTAAQRQQQNGKATVKQHNHSHGS